MEHSDYPKDWQTLLDAFVHARKRVIYEFSGDITHEANVLFSWAYGFACSNRLVPPLPSECGIFVPDSDDSNDW